MNRYVVSAPPDKCAPDSAVPRPLIGMKLLFCTEWVRELIPESIPPIMLFFKRFYLSLYICFISSFSALFLIPSFYCLILKTGFAFKELETVDIFLGTLAPANID